MFIVTCPHCHDLVIIEQVNCAIFRHGVIISSWQQINPHESKIICDDLFNNNLIFGCGKPFKIIKNDDDYVAEVCDYI